MLDFLLKYWSQILASLSFIISVSILIRDYFAKKMNIDISELVTVKVGSQSIYVFLNITNRSSTNIAILNAHLDGIEMYRHIHRFTTNESNPLENRSTTPFPVNIPLYGTTAVLMEFCKSTNWNYDKSLTLQLDTDKGTRNIEFVIGQKIIPLKKALRII